MGVFAEAVFARALLTMLNGILVLHSSCDYKATRRTERTPGTRQGAALFPGDQASFTLHASCVASQGTTHAVGLRYPPTRSETGPSPTQITRKQRSELESQDCSVSPVRSQ